MTRKPPPPRQDDWLPLGTVVHDEHGYPWVYLGYIVTNSGTLRRTFRIALPNSKKMFPADWEYDAVKVVTLVKKFPDLAPHVPEGVA